MHLKVAVSTLYTWKSAHEEFQEALEMLMLQQCTPSVPVRQFKVIIRRQLHGFAVAADRLIKIAQVVMHKAEAAVAVRSGLEVDRVL